MCCNHVSSISAGRALRAGNEPTIPAVHCATTSSGLEMMNRGAPIAGMRSRARIWRAVTPGNRTRRLRRLLSQTGERYRIDVGPAHKGPDPHAAPAFGGADQQGLTSRSSLHQAVGGAVLTRGALLFDQRRKVARKLDLGVAIVAARITGEHRGTVHDAYLMRIGEHRQYAANMYMRYRVVVQIKADIGRFANADRNAFKQRLQDLGVQLDSEADVPATLMAVVPAFCWRVWLYPRVARTWVSSGWCRARVKNSGKR